MYPTISYLLEDLLGINIPSYSNIRIFCRFYHLFLDLILYLKSLEKGKRRFNIQNQTKKLIGEGMTIIDWIEIL